MEVFEEDRREMLLLEINIVSTQCQHSGGASRCFRLGAWIWCLGLEFNAGIRPRADNRPRSTKWSISTSRHRNSSALWAWLCVDTETRRSLTNICTVEPRLLRFRADAASPRAAAPANEEADPVHIGFLGLEAIVFVTKQFTRRFQQAWRLGRVGDRHHGEIKTCTKTTRPSVAYRHQDIAPMYTQKSVWAT